MDWCALGHGSQGNNWKQESPFVIRNSYLWILFRGFAVDFIFNCMTTFPFFLASVLKRVCSSSWWYLTILNLWQVLSHLVALYEDMRRGYATADATVSLQSTSMWLLFLVTRINHILLVLTSNCFFLSRSSISARLRGHGCSDNRRHYYGGGEA